MSIQQRFNLILFFAGFFPAINSFGQRPQGLFLNDFQLKEATIPTYSEYTKPVVPATTTVSININDTVAAVSKYLYGNNANVYMTQMVDQPTLLSHIQKLSPNVIRFPGGNISSVYLWNAEKNVPPADAPAQIPDANGTMQNPGYWFGKNTEGWTMSVDNYYQMLQTTGNTGIITLNYGYARYSTAADPVAAAAHLAADWVRYDNGRTKFWEVGNESNGTWQAGYRINTAANQDGQPQIITGALYGQHFKVFADSMQKAAAEVGATIYIGAQLLAEAPQGWWNDTDKNWNNGVFQQAGSTPDYYIIHSYYTPYNTNSSAADIMSTGPSVTKDMMDYVTNSTITAGLPVKPLALTEWNIFAVGSKQMASYINGMHAAIVLGELAKNKYGLATRWDLANGWDNGNDHGMFSQGDESMSIPRWTPRAVYYYMYYFQKYFGNHIIASTVTGNSNVLAYASKFNSGELGIVVVNKSTSSETVSLNIPDFGYGNRFYMYSLTGGTDNGEFSLKVYVNGQGPTYSAGGPPGVETIKARSATIGDGIKFTASARSVNYILVESGDSEIITGTEGLDEAQIAVSPNPAGSQVLISNISHVESITIIDMLGHPVGNFQNPLHKSELYFNVNGYSRGIHLLKFCTTNHKVIIKKVILE